MSDIHPSTSSMSEMWGFDELRWGLHEEDTSDEEQWDEPVDGEQWDEPVDGEQWDEPVDGQQCHVQGMDEPECDQDEHYIDEFDGYEDDLDSVDSCGDFSDDDDDEEPFDPERGACELLDQQMTEQWIGDLYDEDDWDNEPIEDEDMIIDYYEESCNCPACRAHDSS